MFVAALAGVGAEPVRCESTDEFIEALKKVGLRKDARFVFVPESYVADAREAVASFRRRSDVALLSLPTVASKEHAALNEVRHLVEQGTGASLI